MDKIELTLRDGSLNVQEGELLKGFRVIGGRKCYKLYQLTPKLKRGYIHYIPASIVTKINGRKAKK